MENAKYSSYIFFEFMKCFWLLTLVCVVWWKFRNWKITETHKLNQSYCYTPVALNKSKYEENYAGDPTMTNGFIQGVAIPSIEFIGGECDAWGVVSSYPTGIAIEGEVCSYQIDELGYGYYLGQDTGQVWDANFITGCLGYNEGSGDDKGQEYWNNTTEGW